MRVWPELDMVLLLLKHGAAVNFRSHNGVTALISNGKAPWVQLLLEFGANANASNDFGYTPLDAAVAAGDARSIHLLVAKGALVDAVDDEGENALMHAAAGGNLSCVSALLACKAKADARNAKGETALSLAQDMKIRQLLREAERRSEALVQKPLRAQN